MCDSFRIITAPEQKIMAVRKRMKTADLQKGMRSMFDEVGVYMAKNGIEITGPPLTYYHVWSGDEIDIECGFPFVSEADGEGHIHLLKLPLGRAAMSLALGSYSLLPGMHARMDDWIKSKGYTPSPVMWEFYLNDPDMTPEESLKTQIFWPMS